MAERRASNRTIQANITRAIKAAVAAGKDVVRTEIGPDGSIVLHHGDAVTAPATPFDAWKAGRSAH